jgi:hypothetical protein
MHRSPRTSAVDNAIMNITSQWDNEEKSNAIEVRHGSGEEANDRRACAVFIRDTDLSHEYIRFLLAKKHICFQSDSKAMDPR